MRQYDALTHVIALHRERERESEPFTNRSGGYCDNKIPIMILAEKIFLFVVCVIIINACN